MKLKSLQIIDLVRSFSILGVLAVHSSSYTRPLENHLGYFIFYHFQRNGSYGVYVFFVVSGFLITRILDQTSQDLFKPDFKAFYIRRAGRILPLLLVTVLLGALAWNLLPQDAPRVWNCFGILLHGSNSLFWLSIFTFTFNWLLLFPKMIVFWGSHWGVLWTLSIEEQFYFLFPFVLKKCGTPQKITQILLGVILASLLWRLVAYFLFPDNYYMKFYFPPGVFDLFAIGILLYLASRRLDKYFEARKGTSGIICLVRFVLILGDFFETFYSNSIDQIYASTVLGLGLFAFLLGGMHLSFFESGLLKILSLPGKYCYGMYLLHPLVLFFVGSILPKMNGLLAFMFFSSITAALAGVSYHWFEMPSNQLIRRFGKLRE